jgi:hypothetical protein
MSKQFSSDLKMKVVKYYHKVDNYSKVCKNFECNERSLKRWVEKYEINKTLERKKREEGLYKIKKEHIQFIKETLKKYNTITMEQLHKLTIDKFKNLRDNNITRKRATFKHFPKTYRGELKNEELKKFFKEIKKYNLDDIISID